MTALPKLLEQFRYCRLTFTVQLQRECKLPAHKGSMLHGWFGQALKRFNEGAYRVFFVAHEQQQPKPYVVVTPPDYRTQYAASELFEFSIILLGHTCDLAERVIEALQRGASLGLGKERTPFELVSVNSVLPNGPILGIAECTIAEFVGNRLQNVANHSNQPEQQLAINFKTPIRVKHQNQIVQDSLRSVGFVGIQVARRLTQLARYWVTDTPDLLDSIMANQPYYKEYEFTERLQYETWQRFSLKQREQLPFSGLKGQVSAFGDFTHLLPLLYAGECVHVGSKTTFGFGEMEVIAAC